MFQHFLEEHFKKIIKEDYDLDSFSASWFSKGQTFECILMNPLKTNEVFALCNQIIENSNSSKFQIHPNEQIFVDWLKT